MINSLKDYIGLIRNKGLLLEVKESLSRNDVPELIEKLSTYRKVLLFENVEGYNCKLVANLVPSHDVFAELFGEADNPYKFFLEGVKRTEKKVTSTDRAYTSISMAGKDILDFLPILKHYVKDSAPYITTGIVSTPDPESGAIGRGIHRMEYRGGNLLGAALLNPPIKDIYEKYKEKNEKMPVTVSIGVDPIIFLSMALKVPVTTDKLEIAGGLKGRGIEVISSFDSAIDVPVGTEFLLEGYIEPYNVKQDGPLGEISGYYLTIKETPTFVVQKLSYRDSPIYHALLPTSLEADMYLTFVSRAHIEDSVKKLFPFISRITFVQKTFGSSIVVNVNIVERHKIRNLLLFLLSFPMIKKALVVDEDVDAEDLRDVEWALVTRCSADEDVIILKGLQGQPIDPQVKDGSGITKIGIDATIQGKSIEERAQVVKGNHERIEKILQSIK